MFSACKNDNYIWCLFVKNQNKIFYTYYLKMTFLARIITLIFQKVGEASARYCSCPNHFSA